MINIRSELANYPPIDLTKILERNPELPDNIKNSIVLYNKALENLRMNSEDIAIIELKKVVSMNPGFHEAINLLGICYSYINEKEKAAEMFEKVISLESNGVNALRYLNDISPEGAAAPNSGDSKKSKRPSKKLQKDKKREPSILKSLTSTEKASILKYLIGFAAGALVIFVISLLFNLPVKGTKNEPEDTRVSEITSQLNEVESKYKKLDEDYNKLKEELEAKTSENDYYKMAMKLFDIENQLTQKKYEEAADALLLLKTVEFSGVEKARFESLYKDTMPKAAKSAYDQGYNLYSTKQYSSAVEKLSKVEVYDSKFDKMDAALYYLGKCYVEVKDSRNAVNVFQRVVKEYPKSSFAKYAQYRLNELTEIP